MKYKTLTEKIRKCHGSLQLIDSNLNLIVFFRVFCLYLIVEMQTGIKKKRKGCEAQQVFSATHELGTLIV